MLCEEGTVCEGRCEGRYLREGVREGEREGVRGGVREGVKSWLGRDLVWVLGRCNMKQGHVSD